MPYQPRPDLDQYLTTQLNPRVGTAEFDMVVYWQWVHHSWHPKSPEQGWEDLRMTPAHAYDALKQRLVPLEIYEQARARAAETGKPLPAEAEAPVLVPKPYEPRPGLAGYLGGLSPRMNTAEWDMVIYWQWTRMTVNPKSPEQAWIALRMTPANARDAIAKKLVPMEIYEQAKARALETGLPLPVEMQALAVPASEYEPRGDLTRYLLTLASPKVGSSEFDMVVYWQWVHASPSPRPIDQAWSDLHMTPANAGDAIGKRIVPLEIYPLAKARAAV